jgi:hypothetical protein
VATRLFVFLSLGSACTGHESQVEIKFIPAVGTEVEVFSFDPVALLDSLVLTAAPRPTFPEIQLEIADYAVPRTEGMDSVSTSWRQLRDSVQRLSDRLRAMDRNSAEYRSEYQRFRDLYARFATAGRDRDRTIRALLGRDRELANRVAAAADTLRIWEEVAYAGLDSALEANGASSPKSATTGTDGAVRMTLGPGEWWISARVPHPTNPFLEYFWNQGLTITGWKRNYRVPLSLQNAFIRWRH